MQMQNTLDHVKLLHEAIKRDDHNEVYEYSKMLLKEYPEDIEYLQCFIISSLRISLADDLASNIFKTMPVNELLLPLYAYYLYIQGEHEKSIKCISDLPSPLAFRLLLAQNYFKIQQYDRSAALMNSLLKELKHSKESRETYSVNLLATGVNSVLTPAVIRDYDQSYLAKGACGELFYNYALLAFEIGDYERSLTYLDRFAKTLQANNHNDAINVKLFRDFIDWKCGKQPSKQIGEEYEQLRKKSTDPNVQGVLRNNMLFFKGNEMEKTHQSLHMLDESLESKCKMTKKQTQIILMNKISILLRKGRIPEAQKILREIQANYDCHQDVDFLKSKYFLLKKCKQSKEIDLFIVETSKEMPELAFCMRADLARERNSQTELIGELKNTTDSKHPMIKNYIFSLLVQKPVLFDQYSEYLSELVAMTNDHAILSLLLRVYESKDDIIKQKAILSKLLLLQPKDSNSKVKLAKLYLKEGNISEAEDLLKGVENPEEIGDIAYLQFIEKNIHVSKKDDEVPIEQVVGQKDQKKKINKKKVRLPKNMDKFIDNFKGDPERWLPKWQRKGYKKKGKKGGKTQGLATVSKQETKNVYTTGASTSSKEVAKDVQKRRK